MKKILLFFSVFIIALSIFDIFSLAANLPKVYLEDIIKYENNENVTVNIYMENVNTELVTLGLDLKYDTSKLEYVSSKAGKDLKATLKLDENLVDESRVAIGIVAINGLKNDGLYYQITFKVKDTKADIPLDISVREATDSNGNDIKIETVGAKIQISNEEKEEDKNETEKIQPIENFEVKEVEDLSTIEEIITDNTSIKIGTDDIFTYDVEDSSIVEVLSDGTMIPNENGTSKVGVKINGQDVGIVEVTVKDGKIEKVVGKAEAESNIFQSKENLSETENVNILENNSILKNADNQENVNSKAKNYFFAFAIAFIVVIAILVIRKHRRKK